MATNREVGEARFWSRVEPTGFCWNWTGNPDKDGYASTALAGKRLLVHRIAYTLLVGEIPKGLTLDHLCRNKLCVNPDHLEPVTGAENVRRHWRLMNRRDTYTRVRPAPKTQRARGADGKPIQCKNGHKLDPSNTLLSRRSRDSGTIRSRCAVCQHATQEANRRKKGAIEQGRRGTYGPRDHALFEEYWGFTYVQWLSGDVRPVDGALKLVA